MPLLNPANLKQTFSASHYIQATGGDIIFPEKLTSRAQWIIGRSQCIYRIFETSSFPAKNREEALQLQVKRWAPFTSTGFHAVWSDALVKVWAWDQALVDQHIEEVGVQAISVLPESVYYPIQEDTAACWVSSVDGGYIFQLWQHRQLFAEKWFAEIPSKERFTLFLRSLAQPSSYKIEWGQLKHLADNAVIIDSAERLIAPWGAKSKNWSIVKKLPWEHSLILGLVCTVLATYLWVLTGTILSYVSLQKVKDRSLLAASDVESILSAREQAETLNAQTETLLELIDYPSQTVMMEDSAKILKEFSLTLKDWDYSGPALEITTVGRVNTLNVVKAFEKLKWVNSVSVSALRSNDQNKFILNLEPAV